jgi:hypothetical protein
MNHVQYFLVSHQQIIQKSGLTLMDSYEVMGMKELFVIRTSFPPLIFAKYHI